MARQCSWARPGPWGVKRTCLQPLEGTCARTPVTHVRPGLVPRGAALCRVRGTHGRERCYSVGRRRLTRTQCLKKDPQDAGETAAPPAEGAGW